MIRTTVLFLCASAAALAQTQVNYAFKLPNGALVLYQVYSQVTISDGDKALAKAEAVGNRIRRVLLDNAGIPWLGFDIQVERVAGRNEFRLSVDPIERVPFFARKPDARTIQSADRVLLDVLREPSTGKRVFDTFQVGMPESPMQIMPMPKSIPDIPAPGTRIRLANSKLISGNETLGWSETTQQGPRLGLKTGTAGQFLIATAPAPGYRMEAIAEENSIRFLAGAKEYRIECTASILERPGAWYLWVKSETGVSGGGDRLTLFVP